MTNQELIEEVKNRLVKTYNPVAIYLFGAYLCTCATRDSDMDLLIIVDASNEKWFERVRPGHYALFGLNVSKDLIVYTKEEFERLSNNIVTLGYKIKKEGKVIYTRP